MDTTASAALRELVEGRRIAALGTLHQGEPFVSMVPYAVLADGAGLVVHVSHLSAHTQDMIAHPHVSVMIAAQDSPDAMVQALPRVTVQADAARLAPSEPGYRAAHEAYLGRFPHAASIFALPGFSLFVLRPVSIRLIAGFAQAITLPGTALATALGRS